MKTKLLITICLAAILAAACCNRPQDASSGEIKASSDVAVTSVEQGDVGGYLEDGIYVFKGIPYAKAERFMAPTAPDSWEGIRSSRAYGPTCPQGKRMGWYSDEQAFAFSWDDGFPDENCLRVNIWTRGLKDGGKRPVMVWLHGGGYSAGSGQELPSYDGASLAKKGDVVVVSLNHRLNVLGFLDLSAYGDEYADSGNAGLLDIVAALKWVKTNIASFGGDASNVTIFGQSGGGGKVSTLLATPSAEGLFHKAIIQSGSMLRTMEAKWSRRIGEQTFRNLGVKDVAELKTIEYEKLLAAGEKAITQVRADAEKEGGVSSFIFGWAPTVEGRVLPCQPFDPVGPEQSKDIPVMLGTTLHEFTASTYVPMFRNISQEQAVEFCRQKYGEHTEAFLAAFEKAYPEYQPKDLIDTDFTFRPGTIAQADIKAGQGGAPVYMYMFGWESPVMDGILRSTHCMEIPFVFNNATRHASMTGGGAEALKLADVMSGAWINFARTGNPNASGLPEWPAYTPKNGALMFFDNECEVKYSHDRELIGVISRFPVRGF